MKRKLTQKAVEHAKPGKHYDDHGLILTVRPSGSKYWFWRGTVRGKRTDLGVGTYPYVSLAEARDIAFQYRKLSKAGQDPRVNRGCPTFADALETVIALHRRTWKPGGGSEQQWRSELGTHAIPHLRSEAGGRDHDHRRDGCSDDGPFLDQKANDREACTPENRSGDEVGYRSGTLRRQPGRGCH